MLGGGAPTELEVLIVQAPDGCVITSVRKCRNAGFKFIAYRVVYGRGSDPTIEASRLAVSGKLLNCVFCCEKRSQAAVQVAHCNKILGF
jgi:hypothetical protein